MSVQVVVSRSIRAKAHMSHPSPFRFPRIFPFESKDPATCQSTKWAMLVRLPDTTGLCPAEARLPQIDSSGEVEYVPRRRYADT